MKKTAVITGGAGFIGSHLCERLMQEGYKVICVDNLITGKIQNIRHLLDSGDFTFIKHNITTYLEIRGGVDCVLHFASPASPVDYLKYPIQTLKAGSLGTHNALGLAKVKKSRFLLASTSEVYGDPLVNPQPEEYWGNVNPIGPRGVYDEAKRFAEAITMAYRRVHKIDAKIVRIFNTYGIRMREEDGRAIPNFVGQALANRPITIYGKGSQTRSFCYISDLIDGIYRLLNSTQCGPINIGNPDETSIRKLAGIIIRLCGSKSKIAYKGLPIDDPKVRRPNINKARSLLKWNPRVSLEDGLKNTIDWFRFGVHIV